MAYTVSIGEQLVSQWLLEINRQYVKNTEMPIIKLSNAGRQWLISAMKNPAHPLMLIPNDVMLMHGETRTPHYQVQRLQY